MLRISSDGKVSIEEQTPSKAFLFRNLSGFTLNVIVENKCKKINF
uniref:Uncharacterized protein n=1 Tax=viral metagenome TaxID=1070528 RepID=A0A6C0JSK4_9ZZZZ